MHTSLQLLHSETVDRFGTDIMKNTAHPVQSQLCRYLTSVSPSNAEGIIKNEIRINHMHMVFVKMNESIPAHYISVPSVWMYQRSQ